MSSYFDLPPAPKPTSGALNALQDADADSADAEEKFSFLTPSISRILDDIDASEEDDSSSSHSESASDHTSQEPAAKGAPRRGSVHESKSASSTKKVPESEKKQVRLAPPPRPGIGASGKNPHLARFHSLRSMLFMSHMEAHKAQCEDDWKAQHDSRKGLERPKTPERGPSKERLRDRVGNKLRRLTSKEMPTIKEPQGDESTASDSEGEGEARKIARKGKDSASPEKDELNESDVDDLVRWMSHRDPPSDNEQAGLVKLLKSRDGSSDSLVQWVTGHHSTSGESDHHQSDEDVSTASDSEGSQAKKGSLAPNDVDELVKWVSRKEEKRIPTTVREDSGVHELEDASTESDSEGQGDPAKKHSINQDDVDKLVRWVSRKDENWGPVGKGKSKKEEIKQASGSNSKPEAKDKRHESLDQQDVDELVRWVSRK